MLKPWTLYALSSLLLYGFWGFWGSLASHHSNARSILFFSSLGTLVAGITCLLLLRFHLDLSLKGAGFGALTGISTGFGTLFLIMALHRNGPTASIIMLTALYPVITILLSLFILHEPITLKQGIGMMLSMVAIYLLL